MAGVPYAFATATTSIPLSQLDADFNTGLTIGNTTVGLGNTVTSLGNVTLANVTIISGTSNIAASGNVTIGNTTIGLGNTATSLGNVTLANSTINFAASLSLGNSTVNTALGQGNASAMKNRIINGAMVINQRAWSGTITADSTYTLDRWTARNDLTSKMSVTQSSDAPAGFNYSLLVTSLSAYSVPASGYYFMSQYVEGFNAADLAWGTASAKTVTISFWVKSSLTGTFGGSILNSGETRCYPFSYTISAANTWEQKSVTIVGDTTGTWVGATNGVAMRVSLEVGIGTSLSSAAGAWTATSSQYGATGATNVLGTNGATIQWTGVQLEVGSSATGFEYRMYGTELANCQRYYEVIGGANNGGADSFYQRCQGTSGQTFAATYPFQVTKRTAPTTTKVGTWSVQNANQPATGGTSATNYYIYVTASATGDVYFFASNSSQYITASAEL